MNITTVGELIDALSTFDRNLPILKSDLHDLSYVPIHITEKMVFPVQRVVVPGGDYFVDVITGIEEGKKFDAVVL